MTCTPGQLPLRYPAKCGGATSLEGGFSCFSVDKSGAPSQVKAAGDPLLSGKRAVCGDASPFPRECAEKGFAVRILFRFDETMSLDSPDLIRRVSETEHEISSPSHRPSFMAAAELPQRQRPSAAEYEAVQYIRAVSKITSDLPPGVDRSGNGRENTGDIQ